MPKVMPYQPLVLRLCHGISGVLSLLALLTGFLVYNTYDKRFGSLAIPALPDSQGVHGTFGLFFLLTFPLLAVYSFYWGSQKLLQANFLRQLSRDVGKPKWWYNLQRMANTLMLLASTLAVVTGRMMKEEWLPAGELDRLWYSLHLLGWLVLLIALLIHLAMSLKVGGMPLLLSMVQLNYRPEESPALWIGQLKSRFKR